MEQQLITYLLKKASLEEVREILNSKLEASDFVAYGDVYSFIQSHISKHEKKPSGKLFRANFPQENYPLCAVEELVNTWQELVECLIAKTSAKEINTELELIETEKSKPVPDFQSISDTAKKLAGRLDARHSEFDSFDAGDNHDNFIDDYLAEKDMPVAIPTPYHALNEVTGGGLKNGQFWLLSAMLFTGKTWTGMDMAAHAWLSGKNVLVWTGEMPHAELYERICALRTKLCYDKINKFKLSAEEFELFKAPPPSSAGYLKIFGSGNSDVSSITDLESLIDQEKPDFVVVDGLYILTDGQRTRNNETVRIKNLAQETKRLALRKNIPILGIIQQGVDGEKKKKARIGGTGMEAAYGGLAWAMAADIFLEMYGDTISRIKTIAIRKLRKGVPSEFLITLDTKGFTALAQVGIQGPTETEEMTTAKIVEDSQKVVEGIFSSSDRDIAVG
jgi:hypothetical protein